MPCLLIDPKGDLTNLCLTFPDLAPADFRPWINEGDAQKAGVTPDEFAEQQATAWRDGVGGLGHHPERIEALRDACGITIYTPGSTPVCRSTSSGRSRRPPARATWRSCATRSRATCRACSAWSASRRIPSPHASTSS